MSRRHSRWDDSYSSNHPTDHHQSGSASDNYRSHSNNSQRPNQSSNHSYSTSSTSQSSGSQSRRSDKGPRYSWTNEKGYPERSQPQSRAFRESDQMKMSERESNWVNHEWQSNPPTWSNQDTSQPNSSYYDQSYFAEDHWPPTSNIFVTHQDLPWAQSVNPPYTSTVSSETHYIQDAGNIPAKDVRYDNLNMEPSAHYLHRKPPSPPIWVNPMAADIPPGSQLATDNAISSKGANQRHPESPEPTSVTQKVPTAKRPTVSREQMTRKLINQLTRMNKHNLKHMINDPNTKYATALQSHARLKNREEMRKQLRIISSNQDTLEGSLEPDECVDSSTLPADIFEEISRVLSLDGFDSTTTADEDEAINVQSIISHPDANPSHHIEQPLKERKRISHYDKRSTTTLPPVHNDFSPNIMTSSDDAEKNTETPVSNKKRPKGAERKNAEISTNNLPTKLPTVSSNIKPQNQESKSPATSSTQQTASQQPCSSAPPPSVTFTTPFDAKHPKLRTAKDVVAFLRKYNSTDDFIYVLNTFPQRGSLLAGDGIPLHMVTRLRSLQIDLNPKEFEKTKWSKRMRKICRKARKARRANIAEIENDEQFNLSLVPGQRIEKAVEEKPVEKTNPGDSAWATLIPRVDLPEPNECKLTDLPAKGSNTAAVISTQNASSKHTYFTYDSTDDTESAVEPEPTTSNSLCLVMSEPYSLNRCDESEIGNETIANEHEFLEHPTSDDNQPQISTPNDTISHTESVHSTRPTENNTTSTAEFIETADGRIGQRTSSTSQLRRTLKGVPRQILSAISKRLRAFNNDVASATRRRNSDPRGALSNEKIGPLPDDDNDDSSSEEVIDVTPAVPSVDLTDDAYDIVITSVDIAPTSGPAKRARSNEPEDNVIQPMEMNPPAECVPDDDAVSLSSPKRGGARKRRKKTEEIPTKPKPQQTPAKSKSPLVVPEAAPEATPLDSETLPPCESEPPSMEPVELPRIETAEPSGTPTTPSYTQPNAPAPDTPSSSLSSKQSRQWRSPEETEYVEPPTIDDANPSNTDGARGHPPPPPVNDQVLQRMREIDTQMLALQQQKMQIDEIILQRQREKMAIEQNVMQLQNERTQLFGQLLTQTTAVDEDDGSRMSNQPKTSLKSSNKRTKRNSVSSQSSSTRFRRIAMVSSDESDEGPSVPSNLDCPEFRKILRNPGWIRLQEPDAAIDSYSDSIGAPFSVHRSPIVHLQVVDQSLIAAGEDGRIYKFDLLSGQLLETIKGHSQMITGFVFPAPSVLLSISLDGHLRINHLAPDAELPVSLDVGEPLLKLDFNWDRVFIGSQKGNVFLYRFLANRLQPKPLCRLGNAITELRATNDGERHTLIIATTVNHSIQVRDAPTGLLLRIIQVPNKLTVNRILVDGGALIRCGTNEKHLFSFLFASGEIVGQKTLDYGLVCWQMYGTSLLLCGNSEGHIDALDKETFEFVCRISEDCTKTLLEFHVFDDRIIISTREDRRLRSIALPPEVLTYTRN